MHRAAAISLALSVILAGGAGCGRPRALPVPNGDVGDSGDRPVAVVDGSDAEDAAVPAASLDTKTSDAALLEALDAPIAMSDANIDALAPTVDAAADSISSLPPNRYRAIAIAVARLHVCALLDDHKVKCWGENGYGQLGLGDTMSRGTDPATTGDNLPTVDLGTARTVKSVTGGRDATCAILDDDELKCWGGGLAAPNLTTNIGDKTGDMGDHLKPIALGDARKPVAVAIGWRETCVALDDGSFLCWSGSPSPIAAAADGARVIQLARDLGTVGVFDDGSVRRVSVWAPSGPTPVDFGSRPATFVAGTYGPGFSGDCTILRTGGTACTSDTIRDPLPLPSDASVVAIAITEYGHACGLDSAGVVTCWKIQPHPEWGDAAKGSTVRVPLGLPATAIGAGDYNACALLADGSVKCWAVDGTFAPSLGGSVATPTGWSAVDLGTRPTP